MKQSEKVYKIVVVGKTKDGRIIEKLAPINESTSDASISE